MHKLCTNFPRENLGFGQEKNESNYSVHVIIESRISFAKNNLHRKNYLRYGGSGSHSDFGGGGGV